MALVTNSLLPRDGMSLAPPFPGNGAQFIVEGDIWKISDHDETHLARSLNLKSQTDNSLFESVSICGYRKGEISFFSYFRHDPNCEVEMYFKNWTIPVFKGLRAETAEQRAAIFQVLNRYNTLPPEHLDLIRKLAHAQNWFEVTPLGPNEHLRTEIPSSRMGISDEERPKIPQPQAFVNWQMFEGSSDKNSTIKNKLD